MEADWVIVPQFPHRKGFHCESTTLRDHLAWLGLPLSEAMVFGLDATMGFVFWEIPEDRENFFVIGGKQGSFSKDSLACRLLGIELDYREFRAAQDAWLDAQKRLEQNIPLIIQADIGYLPFIIASQPLEEGEIHFGGHLLTLAGYHQKKALAWIYDNNFSEGQSIGLQALSQARGSTAGPKFLHPHYRRYLVRRRADGKQPPIGAGIKLALKETSQHILHPSNAHQGIAGLQKFAVALEKWSFGSFPSIQAERQFFNALYGYIETYGTGGGLFRPLFSMFLRELVTIPDLRMGPHAWNPAEFDLVLQAATHIDRSGVAWTQFALYINRLLNQTKGSIFNILDLLWCARQIDEIIAAEQRGFELLNGLKL